MLDKELGVDLDEHFPPDSSAVVVVIDDEHLDRVQAALAKADKKISKAIDQADYDELSKAISEGAQDVDDAVES